MRTLLLALATLAVLAPAGAAQQKLGFVDSPAILQAMPEYQTARQEVDRLAQQWQAELDAMQREVDALEREFQARELLYTADERQRKQEEIEAARTAMGLYRRRQFGPEGELFREEQQRMRPVQERVLEAVEAVAEEAGYDYVLDRGGSATFLFARPAHNLTELVLERLGINPAGAPAGTGVGG